MNTLETVGVLLATWAVVAALVLCAVDRDTRDAFVGLLLLIITGPGLVALLVRSRAPRVVRLSPRALQRFARAQGADGRPAWALTYRNRGVIVVRRTDGRREPLDDVTHRVGRARRGS